MAQRLKQFCRLSGCNRLTRDPSGYCEKHQKGHRKAKGDNKKSDPFYSSKRWIKFTKWYKGQHPLCEMCNEQISVITHHLVELKDGGAAFDPDNCQAVCLQCHNKIHKGKGAFNHGS